MDQAAQSSFPLNKLRSQFTGTVAGFSSSSPTPDPNSTANLPQVHNSFDDQDTDEQLRTLEEVFSEIEQKRQANPDQNVSVASDNNVPQRISASGMMVQAVPQVVQQMDQALLHTQGGTSQGQKEAVDNLQVFESIPGARVEYEESPEISPEVEEFVKKVEQDEQIPQEIAISGDNITISSPQKLAKKAVVVLPITPEVEQEGEKKGPKYSVRWLVEFARKIMKMFSGEVVYKS